MAACHSHGQPSATGPALRERETLAGILDILFDDYKVNSLGFDVLFAEADRGGGNQAFAEAFITRNIVTGFVFKDSLSQNEPEFTGK